MHVPLGFAALLSRDVAITTLNFPLTLSNNQFTVQVDMGPAANQQSFNFSIATNVGYTLVATQGCTTCSSALAYDPGKSTTSRNLSLQESLPVTQGLTSGTLVKEDCRIRQGGGSPAWNYPNQTILAVNEASPNSGVFSELTSGIVGLGLTGPNLSFEDTIYGGFFHRNPNTPRFGYGMALNDPNAPESIGQGSAGTIHWMQPDTSAYQESSVVWSNLTAGVKSPDPIPLGGSSDWVVPIQGWSVLEGSERFSNSAGGDAIMEPLVPDIYLPRKEADSIYKMLSDVSSVEADGYVLYRVACNSKFTWSVSIKDSTFVIPASSLVIKKGDHCEGTIRGWSSDSQAGYLFGSSFISAVYLIFSVGREGGSSAAIGVAQRALAKAKSSTPIGAIVGGVVGGVALIALVGLVACIWLRRRQKRQPPAVDPAQVRFLDEKSGNPFMTPPTTAGVSGVYPPYNPSAVNEVGVQEITMPGSPVPSSSVHYYPPTTASPTAPHSAISVIERSNGAASLGAPSTDGHTLADGRSGQWQASEARLQQQAQQMPPLQEEEEGPPRYSDGPGGPRPLPMEKRRV